MRYFSHKKIHFYMILEDLLEDLLELDKPSSSTTKIRAHILLLRSLIEEAREFD